MSCQFNASIDIQDSSSSYFLMILKPAAGGKYTPVYKTESKRKHDKPTLAFARILSNTDALADSNPDTNLMFQLFKFDSSGQGRHKKVS